MVVFAPKRRFGAVAVSVIVLGLLVLGCDDGDTGDAGSFDGARTYYESLDLSSPRDAVVTFTDAFAGDDFMTVWLTLDPQAQFAFQQYINQLDHDRLVHAAAIDDFDLELREVLSLDARETGDSWYVFDSLMMMADRHGAFLIDLSGPMTMIGVSDHAGDTTMSEVTAEVGNVDGVVFRVRESPSGRWRVVQVIIPGGDEATIPWSTP